jgi:murein DD-endopeptidase MepM/ murein hydrolase activator NlpD
VRPRARPGLKLSASPADELTVSSSPVPSVRSVLRTGMVAAALILVVGACEAASPPPPTTTTVPPQVVRPITFPVEGPVTFTDTFGAPRSGGRTHQGIDLMGKKMQRLLAAADGEVTALRHDNSGLSGNSLTITDAQGWRYVYIHINNDTPGTDDGANRFEHAFAPGMRRGAKVTAGQHVAYLGDSGNAENTPPHLHFEIHTPNGQVINPYPSLMAVVK